MLKGLFTPQRNRSSRCLLLAASIGLWASRCAVGDEAGYPPPSADEPIAKSFSLGKASGALDRSAAWWQTKYGCCHCHANMMYLVARPALYHLSKSDGRVREFFEQLVLDRWEKKGLRYEPEAVVVAVPLAIHDGRTTGKLHPATRRALDRMITLQRPEGNWTLVAPDGSRREVEGEKQAFFLGYEQMLFAAIGIAAAPENYAETKPARAALDKIREYVRKNPPTSLHQKGMLLWAASCVDDLIGDEQRRKAIAQLAAKQRSDGGWAIEEITPGTRKFDPAKSPRGPTSDGYATGFVVYALRRAGVPATDARIRHGIAWLKANQRESGRWYVPSFNQRPNSVLSNSATAYAVLALEACGER
jgi:squalene-hopene/tetraprenyl-beta-curcumene cyclase